MYLNGILIRITSWRMDLSAAHKASFQYWRRAWVTLKRLKLSYSSMLKQHWSQKYWNPDSYKFVTVLRSKIWNTFSESILEPTRKVFEVSHPACACGLSSDSLHTPVICNAVVWNSTLHLYLFVWHAFLPAAICCLLGRVWKGVTFQSKQHMIPADG